MLNAKGIHYLDVGTSGGIWGLERGYCMMIGGDKDAVEHLDPIFATLAPGIGDDRPDAGPRGRDPRVEQGYLHCGPAGAGHFVKMVHNGIEYGLMQAYAEGFDILRNVNSPAVPENRRYKLDLADVAEVWRRGSVVSSWLLDLTAIALAEDATSRVLRLCRGFGRGALDDPGGDRGGGAGRGAVGGALHPLPLAPGPHLRRKASCRRCASSSADTRSRRRDKAMDSAHDSGRPSGARPPGAALRDGDLWRQRRPDQAPADARRSTICPGRAGCRTTFAVIGVDRSPWSEENFRAHLADGVRSFVSDTGNARSPSHSIPTAGILLPRG